MGIGYQCVNCGYYHTLWFPEDKGQHSVQTKFKLGDIVTFDDVNSIEGIVTIEAPIEEIHIKQNKHYCLITYLVKGYVKAETALKLVKSKVNSSYDHNDGPQ